MILSKVVKIDKIIFFIVNIKQGDHRKSAREKHSMFSESERQSGKYFMVFVPNGTIEILEEIEDDIFYLVSGK